MRSNYRKLRLAIFRLHMGWEASQGEHRQYIWQLLTTFVIPKPLFKWWNRWVYRPLAMRLMPWHDIETRMMDCPICEIEYLEGRHSQPLIHHFGLRHHPSIPYDQDEEEGEDW